MALSGIARGAAPLALVLAFTLPFTLVASTARAADPPPGFTFLPGAGRGISRGTSASRDAPVIEYAYGPRAQASLGVEPAIFSVANAEGRVWRLGMAALAALENDRKTQPLPKELWRSRIDLFLALELPLAGGFPRGSALETAVGVGRESADWFGYSRPATPPAWGMPFGGGGDWLSLDAALRLPLGGDVELVLRASDRVYWNALPRLAGDRSVSDAIGDGLREGPVNVASAESVLRWRALSWAHPTLALHGEHAFARDPYTADTFFGRALVGFVVPGRTGEAFPFASFDGGNGRGLLVDRRELRFSVGGRLVTF